MTHFRFSIPERCQSVLRQGPLTIPDFAAFSAGVNYYPGNRPGRNRDEGRTADDIHNNELQKMPTITVYNDFSSLPIISFNRGNRE